MNKQLLPAVRMFAALTLLTGIVYPLVMTGVVQSIFSSQANGSIEHSGGAAVGSSLIAQKFTSEKYFWERPSAIDYNPLPSGASNFGPTNLTLDTLIGARRDSFVVANHLAPGTHVPTDMLGASASGLDPHISPEAAFLQVGRVARARNMDSTVVAHIVAEHVEGRQWGMFGDPRVNVLKLNLAMDQGAH